MAEEISLGQSGDYDLVEAENAMEIVVTGGAGFIGSHTVLELLNAGYRVVVLDNLCNSNTESLIRVQKLTRRRIHFYQVSLCDEPALRSVLSKHSSAKAVIHFAALKAVGESVAKPLEYYENNVVGTVVLLRVMRDLGIKRMIFSSSATVYGNPDSVPIDESAPLRPTNPYGRTKLHIEDILRDVSNADSGFQAVLLRYFNPIGAHSSGQIGEDPQGIPNNLMPFVARVAVGRLPKVSVFGNDWPTPDGTGVRDYIHVVDLAKGHVAAVRYIDERMTESCEVFNLGTGTGYSVLQLIEAMRAASGAEIPYEITARRPGDTATVYADPSKARDLLNWTATLNLTEMCRDTWNWQSSNPNGFHSS